jgi:flagellar basal-body rod modification protein FlgD
MTSAITGTTAADGTASSTSTQTTTSSTTKVDKNIFLELLVAQLRNQDPLNPADGTEFVGQLAQFQQLESTLNMGQEVTAIRTAVETLLGTTTTNAA